MHPSQLLMGMQTSNPVFTFDFTCACSLYHPLPPITTFHSLQEGRPWWQPVPPCAQHGTGPPPPLHPSLPPSFHSSIMSRLLNGAQHLASDPFQWSIGSFRGATLHWSQGGAIWSDLLTSIMSHSVQGALSLWTSPPSRPFSLCPPCPQTSFSFCLHSFSCSILAHMT